jgi:transposase
MIFLVEGDLMTDACTTQVPDELRERAVRLLEESSHPITQVAADLGVHREALRNWVRQDEADRGGRARPAVLR